MSEESIVSATTQAPDAEKTVVKDETVTEENSIIDSSEKEVSADKKGDDSVKKEAVVPEKYEIKLKEGMEIDQAALDVFTPLLKELKVSQEGFDKIIDKYVPMIQSVQDKVRQDSIESYKKIIDEWKTETYKELGANAKTEIAYCGKALLKFGSDELRQVLNETGLGNHKELVKFMAKIGKTISEDAFVDGKSKSSADDPLLKMYPSMKQ